MMVERVALLAATAALRESAPAPVAEAFAASRLVASVGSTYGARPLSQTQVDMLLERALPA
jgi:hypothetical protein